MYIVAVTRDILKTFSKKVTHSKNVKHITSVKVSCVECRYSEYIMCTFSSFSNVITMIGHGYNGDIFVNRFHECSNTIVRYCISIYLFLTQKFTYHFSVVSDVLNPVRTTFSTGREKEDNERQEMHTTVRIRKYEVVYYNNIYNHYASWRRVSFSRKTLVMQVTITQFSDGNQSTNRIARFPQKKTDLYLFTSIAALTVTGYTFLFIFILY